VNKMAVLRAFQRRGWPREVRNPFLGNPGVPAKERLHDTIKLLNRSQDVIRFRGDGSGRYIEWEWRK
jgi:hypothetical protein